MSGPSGRFDRTVFRAERYSRFISRETSDCAYATQIVRNALKISKCIMRVINPARERNVSTLGGSFFFFFISLSFSFFFRASLMLAAATIRFDALFRRFALNARENTYNERSCNRCFRLFRRYLTNTTGSSFSSSFAESFIAISARIRKKRGLFLNLCTL